VSRPPLSVCVITLNEAAHLEACLRSADFADEWIVVDSHSTDRTRDIAHAFGARVIERDWPGHIAQKNFAIDAATHDWVLCLDADERLSPELRDAILARLAREPLPDGFTMARRNHYMGRWIRHGGWYPDAKLRLFRRSRGRWTGTDPHDRARVDGAVERLDGDLLHWSYASLSDHLRTIDSFTSAAAKARYARGERARMFDLTLRPWARFLKMYVVKRGFLDGVAGFVIAVMGAFYVFLRYAKMRALERDEAP
jgi:glycosyltransferase involved in cell wall biosynthesis